MNDMRRGPGVNASGGVSVGGGAGGDVGGGCGGEDTAGAAAGGGGLLTLLEAGVSTCCASGESCVGVRFGNEIICGIWNMCGLAAGFFVLEYIERPAFRYGGVLLSDLRRVGVEVGVEVGVFISRVGDSVLSVASYWALPARSRFHTCSPPLSCNCAFLCLATLRPSAHPNTSSARSSLPVSLPHPCLCHNRPSLPFTRTLLA